MHRFLAYSEADTQPAAIVTQPALRGLAQLVRDDSATLPLDGKLEERAAPTEKFT